MKIFPVTSPYTRFLKVGDLRKQEDFTVLLEKYFNRQVLILNCAKTAFYLFLKGLKKSHPEKNEVIIPAYTDSNLILAIRKAGLKVVLCDVNLENFGYDLNDLKNKIHKKTLAILLVHLFGIVQEIDKIKSLSDGAYLIEDFAQGFGGYSGADKIGTLCDYSFTSFGRGKNFSLGGGGLLLSKNKKIFEAVRKDTHRLKTYGLISEILNFLKYQLLHFFSMPRNYGFYYPLLNYCKSKKPLQDFETAGKSRFVKFAGAVLFEAILDSYKKVVRNTIILSQNLKNIGGLIVPELPDFGNAVLTRFPLLIVDKQKRLQVKQKLMKAGFETSYFYLKPVHHHFNLGYKKEELPNACFLAEHLLTLPVHCRIKKADILKMAEIIGEFL